ncbi:MAG: hypothetical protein IPK80_19180 [Nannocystis sp.]|nr:hypothetical protein [Nannocystis sp.]
MQPQLNQIILFEHGSYNGQTRVIDLNNFTPNAVHSFSGTSMQDKASSVRWCLPPGRVVTFCEHVKSPRLPDLSGLGRTIDLIGDGTVREWNLTSRGVGDCLSAFFWRNVDLERGYLIFYRDSQYSDYRQTVFLSEWAPNQAHSVSSWAIQDRMSSVQWVKLDPRVIVELYDTSSGGGSSYRNIVRRDPNGGVEGISSLSSVGMQDKVSSFKIVEKLPVVEEIQAIEIDRRQFPRKSVTIESKGSVTGTQNASIYTANVTKSWTESSTVTVEQSHSTGGTLSYQYSTGGTAFAKNTISVSLRYDYTHTRSDSSSKSEVIQISHQESYPIPPNHAWKFQLILRYDQIDTEFTTHATRWYDIPLLGTTEDTTKIPGRTLYRRVEAVKGVLKGNFAFKTESVFDATPL